MPDMPTKDDIAKICSEIVPLAGELYAAIINGGGGNYCCYRY
jgi:hypothetical protein